MSDAWDADDFEPPPGTGAAGGDAPKIPIAKLDKWAGEDEDDDVKDAWDKSDSDSDSGEEDPDRPKAIGADQSGPEPDSAGSVLLASHQDHEFNLLHVRPNVLTCTFRLVPGHSIHGLKVGSIDAMVPVEKADFDQLDKAVVNKISMYAESPHFPDFVENLIKNMCLDLNATTLKKIKMNVEALHAAKLKDERAKAKKPNAKKGGTIRMDTAKDMFSGGADYDELDDFM
ncbi:hypothetical protein TCAL_14691 [Tigriopus californicus]|uniref:Uncharacterized protein n=1 Tax=Tigriopus californicus TaxID=6832 RepID=A0A553NNT3_TIGCA|nr:hypothetical protein TCAL_14691 [Tigriopus californicus]